MNLAMNVKADIITNTQVTDISAALSIAVVIVADDLGSTLPVCESGEVRQYQYRYKCLSSMHDHNNNNYIIIIDFHRHS